MTKEEIKATTSMTDVVERYGFRPNRAGFINCPFHDGDRTASLKIYPDSFHCYGCGAHGDIFDFVRLAERCDFKTAFRILGGDSGKMSDAAVLRIAATGAEEGGGQAKGEEEGRILLFRRTPPGLRGDYPAG